MKLLLDEMHAPGVAVLVRDPGYDAIAVKERADLIGQPDDDLLRAATADGTAVVTENVKDFAVLHRRIVAEGQQHSGIVFTHTRRFPAPRRTLRAGVAARNRTRSRSQSRSCPSGLSES